MSNFFVSKENIDEDNHVINIFDNDVKYISQVLRMKIGDEINIIDGFANGYKGVIDTVTKDKIIVSYRETYRVSSEPSYQVTLFQGLPKGDKMDYIIQKSVELGVNKIVPVEMARSIVKFDNSKKSKKISRWNEISKNAAQQSGRGIIPEVCAPVSLEQAYEMSKKLDINIVPYELNKDNESTNNVFRSIQKDNSIGIFIGPEGGFDSMEISLLKDNCEFITLGKRILRTETAPLAVLAMLIRELELS